MKSGTWIAAGALAWAAQAQAVDLPAASAPVPALPGLCAATDTYGTAPDFTPRARTIYSIVGPVSEPHRDGDLPSAAACAAYPAVRSPMGYYFTADSADVAWTGAWLLDRAVDEAQRWPRTTLSIDCGDERCGPDDSWLPVTIALINLRRIIAVHPCTNVLLTDKSLKHYCAELEMRDDASYGHKLDTLRIESEGGLIWVRLQYVQLSDGIETL